MIAIINRFREDAVVVTVQTDFGEYFSEVMDFPDERNEILQMAMALVKTLRAPDTDWSHELWQAVEDNTKAIQRELDEWERENARIDDIFPDLVEEEDE